MTQQQLFHSCFINTFINPWSYFLKCWIANLYLNPGLFTNTYIKSWASCIYGRWLLKLYKPQYHTYCQYANSGESMKEFMNLKVIVFSLFHDLKNTVEKTLKYLRQNAVNILYLFKQ